MSERTFSSKVRNPIMSLSILTTRSILSTSLIQVGHERAFSKNNSIGTQSSLMPYFFVMKVKGAFDFKNLKCSILDKSNFIIFMKFLFFISGYFYGHRPIPNSLCVPQNKKTEKNLLSSF